jgi:hypothetical protein
MTRHSRLVRYLATFLAGAVLAGGGYAIAAGGNSTPAKEQTVSIRPTGVGLPLVGLHGTVGAGDFAAQLRSYNDSGLYESDLEKVDGRAQSYLGRRAAHLRKLARKRCRRKDTPKSQCPKPKLALVLDIDETSLSNYDEIQAANFSGTSVALAASLAAGDAPAIQPTLDLFQFAQSKGVDVFFITGRPSGIPFVQERTESNLTSAGYSNWKGLVLNPLTEGVAAYKSGARAAIEQQGYRIVANVGDQESDLHGGHADRAFKLPNPFYFIGDE